jgi:hypothetical protein
VDTNKCNLSLALRGKVREEVDDGLHAEIFKAKVGPWRFRNIQRSSLDGDGVICVQEKPRKAEGIS